MAAYITYTNDQVKEHTNNQTIRTRAKRGIHYREGDDATWTIANFAFSKFATSNVVEIRPADPELKVDVIGLDVVVTETPFTEVEIRNGVAVTIVGRRLTFPTGGQFDDSFLVATPPDAIVAAAEEVGENEPIVVRERALIRTKASVKHPNELDT